MPFQCCQATSSKLIVVSGRYVVGNDEYRKDSLDFVNNEGIQLYRFNLSKEAVSRPAHDNH